MDYFKDYKRMTIGSCSEANKVGNGRYVKSDRFKAGGHSWRIAFYPNGRLSGTTASMSVFLLLDDDDDNTEGGRTTAAAAAADEEVVQVKFSFTLRELSGLPVFMSGTVAAAAFSRRSNAHGFERFVSRDDFEKTTLFKRDRFEIQCGLTVFPAGSKPRTAVQMSRPSQPDPPVVVQTPPPPPASAKPSAVRVPPSAPSTTPTPSVVRAGVPSAAASPKSSVVTATPPPEAAMPAPSVPMSSSPPPCVQLEPLVAGVSGSPASVSAGQKARAPPLSGLPADLGRLLATKEGADVELEVRGKVFVAHKAVLAARSPVFMEELFGPAKEEDTSYVRFIPDMCSEAFEAMLHYLYTDTLPPEITMNSLKEGVELSEDLLAAAERYELKDLKLLTENKLCNQVGITTVLAMLGLAERYQCCKLKKMCLEFIGSCRNTMAVMATGDIQILARSSPSVIKDVITEIVDAREARRRRLINFCIFAFCFILPFLLFAIFS